MNHITRLLYAGAFSIAGVATGAAQGGLEVATGVQQHIGGSDGAKQAAVPTSALTTEAQQNEVVFAENFADSLDGWTVRSFTPADSVRWTYRTEDSIFLGGANRGRGALDADGTGYAMIDFAAMQDTNSFYAQSLVSPAMDLSAYGDEDVLTLTFNQFYAYNPVNGATIAFSVDGGMTFTDTTVVNPALGVNSFTTTPVEFELPASAYGQPSVQVSFNYIASNYLWAVDDIQVVATDAPLFDFADGIDGWTVIRTAPDDEDIWEYETDPELGAENFLTYDAFEAPSAANGFLFFDYDKAVTLVQPDSFEVPPGPPYPILTQSIVSPAFSTQRDGSDTILVMEFYQYFQALNQNAAKISFKFEGEEGIGVEVPVEVNPRFQAFDEAVGFKRIVIPEQFLDRDDVQVVFTYDGDFYLWAIDDISVIPAPYTVDVQLRDNFYAVAPNYATPVNQIRDEVKFLVDVLNGGFVTDTFEIVASVYTAATDGGLGDLIFTDTLLYDGVAPDSLAENQLFEEAFAIPTEVGSYIGLYSVNNADATEDDFNTDDNQLGFRFEITENVFRKTPPASINGSRSVNDDDGSFSYEAGNIYYLTNPEDVTVDSITFRGYNRGFTAETLGDVEFEVFVYGAFGDENGDGIVQPAELEELASQFVTLDTTYLGTLGDARDVVVRFDDPVDVSEYPAFGVSVVYREPEDTEGRFFIGWGDRLGAANFIRSNDELFEGADTTYVSTFSNEVFTDAPEPTYTPIGNNGDARGHNIAAFISGALDTTVAVQDLLDEQELLARPNPVTESLYLDYSLGDAGVDASIEVVNAVGKLIGTQHFANLTSGTLALSTQGWNNGLYYVRIRTSDQRTAMRKVFVIRN